MHIHCTENKKTYPLIDINLAIFDMNVTVFILYNSNCNLVHQLVELYVSLVKQ